MSCEIDSDKLKFRLNRRLQKLARWADKPMDDRQPGELRVMLRSFSTFPTQFKSSFKGVTYNQPATPMYQVSATNSNQNRIQPGYYMPTPIPTSVPLFVPSSSSAIAAGTITLPQRDNIQKIGNLFNPEVAVSTTSSSSAAQSLIAAVPKVHIAVPTMTAQNQISGNSGMFNAVGSSMGMAMGGVSTGTGNMESVRENQQKILKEISDAMKEQSFSVSTSSIVTSIVAPVASMVIQTESSAMSTDSPSVVDAVLAPPAEE